MRKAIAVWVMAIFLPLISGCGSMLAAVESGPIEEDPGKRTVAQRLEDESIETKAIVNIKAADDGFDEANLVIVSYNGYVLIAGQVESEGLKQKAANEVRDIEGVRRIYNELEVAPTTSGKVRSQDVWLTTQVKSALLFRSDTPGSRVKVVTENGVVYLMGLVSSEEADRAAAVARGIENVRKVVKLFELIDPILQS
ncbi:MAG: BON domain-containing protein [Halieaceae bacterium]|nr:BON domain-containing protein [Halieaceae bacterium]